MATLKRRSKKDGNDIVTDNGNTKISFAFQGLDTISDKLLPKDKESIDYLDLSENRLVDLRFLFDLPNLKTLILDKNGITSNVKLPYMDHLHTLWINHNQIKNLSVFIQTLSFSTPSLKYLSMMNNPAAPSFFNGGSYAQYIDYRYYVISQLPRLIMLDDTEITREERSEAERVYTPVLLNGSMANRRSSKPQ
ncbi:unnamed protein product [Didymodactylos carnosus]|uniref:Leucine-rich repeat-containing protein n=1 Tax=Didymodactylos carnosus TaxID=1234261 RepID=A0A813PML0_9BILA|nr:unnamed protein product [Didymodactylos carnosus]CAF0751010.1 unnamed protein product [Didymodactylos carnosus]CAF3494340.1 unnamed protein product [Didymodactylos carnosus]CAF3530601.1 unnamed protein product [Didymodactylos carnosus]